MRGQLLKPAQLAALEHPSAHSNYALGTGVEDSVCAGLVFAHNGGGDGFETNVYVSPDGNRVAVLLLNGRGTNPYPDTLAFEAMHHLYCTA